MSHVSIKALVEIDEICMASGESLLFSGKATSANRKGTISVMVPRKTWVSENLGRISKSRKPFLISLEVSFLHGLFLLFLSL